jgi:hypothetical protein
MKFSELEDGEKRLERFKDDIKHQLEMERLDREHKKYMEWSARMPWIAFGVIGWFFFVLAISTHH